MVCSCSNTTKHESRSCIRGFVRPHIVLFLWFTQVYSSSSTAPMWNGGLWSRTSSLTPNSWHSSSSLLWESWKYLLVSSKQHISEETSEETKWNVLNLNISFRRRNKEFWQSVWGLLHRSWSHCFGTLLSSVLLLWLGHAQLCHRGD